MKEPGFASAAIIGLGLMGGSIALALQALDETIAIVGIDNDANARAQAAQKGIAASADLRDIAGADLVVLAAPVRSILRLLPSVASHAKDGALVLDLGSTKREITAAMASLPERLNPIGGHPMCGKEVSGFHAADAKLYNSAVFVLTPLPRTTRDALDKAQSFVRMLGARPLLLEPARHDRIVALVSHLPFALAVALMTMATLSDQSDEVTYELAAGGFRDSTRLAASDTQMMLDTLLTNRDNVSELLRSCARELDGLADMIAHGNADALAPILESAAQRRREMFR